MPSWRVAIWRTITWPIRRTRICAEGSEKPPRRGYLTNGPSRSPNRNQNESLVANCDEQMEVDPLWGTLSQGGQSGQCGWLKDKYGLSWQIVPTVLREVMQDTDPKKTENVMKALLQMTKLDIAGLEQAYRKQ